MSLIRPSEWQAFDTILRISQKQALLAEIGIIAQDLLRDGRRPQTGRGLEQRQDLSHEPWPGDRADNVRAGFLAEGKRGSVAMRWPAEGAKAAAAMLSL